MLETLEEKARPKAEGPAIHLEGGLFSPDLLDSLAAKDFPGQKPEDFGLPKGTSLLEHIAETYQDAKYYWRKFREALDRLPPEERGTSLTRDRWIIPFLSLLGYELEHNPRAYVVGEETFFISHRAGVAEDAPPVHIAGARQELGKRDPAGPRLSPHALLQEFLNRTDHLWGIVTNGRVLRVLRKTPAVRRQAYLEFDLEALFEADRFEDFVVLFRLLHRSRLPKGIADAHECWLEKYHRQSVELGNRARDRLRDGVLEALKILGNGFLAHPKNEGLRERVCTGALSPAQFYEELLRLVYRFLFLFVAEERRILGGNEVYWRGYSLTRLRRLADDPRAYTEHDDLWLSLRVLWHVLRDSSPKWDGKPLAALLGLPVLDGELFAAHALENLENAHLWNNHLLGAIRHLGYFYDPESRVLRRVNYAFLDVEELGSVYESLLEFRPVFDFGAATPRFGLGEGTERKSTGSYYTPHELVEELVKSALEPVLEERLRQARTPAEKERAILTLRVLDPATGSGHFLLAAARRLGKKLAQIRTGEEEPEPKTVRMAIRDVITHCLYGVDKNPLAVELCKVALWIEGHAEGKPLTFLDHRIRCGDSLVGVFDLSVLEAGIPTGAYEPVAGDDKSFARRLKREVERANSEGESGALPLLDFSTTVRKLAQKLAEIGDLSEDTPAEVQQKAARYRELREDEELGKLRLACDLWTAAFFARLEPAEASRVPKPLDLYQALTRGSAGLKGELVGYVRALAERLRFFHWPLEFPEVFAQGGFDVVLSNPPFLGGLKISGTLGDKYRHWLAISYAPFKGTADLCAAFYRRAFSLLKPNGMLGMVATNTIGQGDTRESGLAVIIQNGGNITFARRFIKWPGAANVEVNLISIRKGKWQGDRMLDSQTVDFISSRLDADPETEPKRLKQNEGKAFQGDIVRGIGFVLEPWEAEQLLEKDQRNADCLFPYLNGEDLNSDPEQKPSRWVICFHDWDLERAKQYPDLLQIVEERVKPERERLHGPGDKRNREFWWQFGAYRQELRRAIAPLQRVLVACIVTQYWAPTYVPKDWVYAHRIAVFAFDDGYHFALFQSNVHEIWARKYSSTLEERLNYSPSDCFDTFPFPLAEYEVGGDIEKLLKMPTFAEAARIGAEYHEHRRQIMLTRQIGLTRTYNLFHNPNCTDADIVRLRELHTQMDKAILACYGWTDIDPQHDFYQNERGQTRFTISPQSRREILHRLLNLNEKIAGVR